MVNWRRWGLPALLVIASLILPWLFDSDKILTTLTLGFIIGALAASWNILGGFAGQINLGHAAFFGIGALVTRYLWLQDTPFALSFLAGGAGAAVAALVVGYPALRLRGIYFAIGTLAMAEAIRITVDNIIPTISALPPETLRSYSLVSRYYLSLGVLLLAVGVTYYLTRSKVGLGMLAVREDEDAARAIGVNTFRQKLVAFILSAALAGLAGGTFAYFHVSYYPSLPFGPEWTFDALIVVFVGGLGTVAGPLIGTLFFVLLRDLLAANFAGIHLLIFGILFVLIVLLLPGGLLEAWQRLVSWQRRRVGKVRSEVAGSQ